MQERQKDRARYFRELAQTSERYFIPYLSAFMQAGPGMDVLEIGCGEGGNLLPFARIGCNVTGVDLATGKIANAIRFFNEAGAEGRFIASDIFKVKELESGFDLIICHDVIEHIADKKRFLSDVLRYLKPGGYAFVAFPAWRMPFGGHQQICRSKVLSRLPFFHLLPEGLYRLVLKAGGETRERISELIEIKDTRLPIQAFEKLLRSQTGDRTLRTVDRTLYFINPHYEAKFGLRPRRLSPLIARIPYIRDFFTTSCFYLLKG